QLFALKGNYSDGFKTAEAASSHLRTSSESINELAGDDKQHTPPSVRSNVSSPSYITNTDRDSSINRRKEPSNSPADMPSGSSSLAERMQSLGVAYKADAVNDDKLSVKEINNLKEKLQEAESLIAKLQQTQSLKDSEIADKNAEIGEMANIIAEKDAEIARLTPEPTTY
ncbi:hypothetical protein HK096_001883, partial [Nowakowskiella sp. JEL0078]